MQSNFERVANLFHQTFITFIKLNFTYFFFCYVNSMFKWVVSFSIFRWSTCIFYFLFLLLFFFVKFFFLYFSRDDKQFVIFFSPFPFLSYSSLFFSKKQFRNYILHIILIIWYLVPESIQISCFIYFQWIIFFCVLKFPFFFLLSIQDVEKTNTFSLSL